MLRTALGHNRQQDTQRQHVLLASGLVFLQQFQYDPFATAAYEPHVYRNVFEIIVPSSEAPRQHHSAYVPRLLSLDAS